MTDLEMTRLCAEAMGFKAIDREFVGRREIHLDIFGTCYAPLHNDAQAMALVKKYRLKTQPIAPAEAGWLVHTCESIPAYSGHGKDLNRAIVECVAKMQQAKAVQS